MSRPDVVHVTEPAHPYIAYQQRLRKPDKRVLARRVGRPFRKDFVADLVVALVIYAAFATFIILW